MDDLISRQSAISEAFEICLDGERFEVVQVETLMGLPSAQPEKVCIAKITLSEEQVREAVEKAKSEIVQMLPSVETEKKGKWVFRDRNECVCSCCKTEAERDGKEDWILSNYCPNCGADMRGEEE